MVQKALYSPLRSYGNPEGAYMDPTVLTRKASSCQHIMVAAIGLIVQAHVCI